MDTTHFFFDVDSTVIKRESLLDLVLEAAGTGDEELENKLLAITNAGMNGEIDFAESVRQRLAIATIRPHHMQSVTQAMLSDLTEGMEQFIRDLEDAGHTAWLLTAGIRDMMLPLGQKLSVPDSRIIANEAIWTDDILTGFREGPMMKTKGKAEIVHGLKKTGEIEGTVIMIGDGTSDLQVFLSGAADDFYGFGEHAVRPNVQKHAPHFFHSVKEMRTFVGL